MVRFENNHPTASNSGLWLVQVGRGGVQGGGEEEGAPVRLPPEVRGRSGEL